LGYAIYPQLHVDHGAGELGLRLSDLRPVAADFSCGRSAFPDRWFIESLATQVLVIFVLRTRGNPLKSRPHPLLAATSIAVVVLAVALPFTPLGAWFGFAPPSATFLMAIAGLTVSYLVTAQGAKRAFYRLWPPVGLAPAPSIRSHLLVGRFDNPALR
jgi:Cation transporting ATPase, C-terminus